MCHIGCISATNGEIFLKIHTSQFPHTHHKRCYRSIIKGTLLGKQNTFSAVSVSIGGIFLKTHTLHFPRICNESCKFDCNQVKSKGTLVGEQCASTAVSGVSLEGFFWRSTSRTSHFPRMFYKECKFYCCWSIFKGTLLTEQSTFQVLRGASRK